MPIPNLDYRDFDQLAGEARALIPRNLPPGPTTIRPSPASPCRSCSPSWSRSRSIQLNRVPERSLRRFADLVTVAEQPDPACRCPPARGARRPGARERASPRPSSKRWRSRPAPAVSRSTALVETLDTPNAFPDEQLVRVVIVPNEPCDPVPRPEPDALRETVFGFLRARRLSPPGSRSCRRATPTCALDGDHRAGRGQPARPGRPSAEASRPAIHGLPEPAGGGVDGPAGSSAARCSARSSTSDRRVPGSTTPAARDERRRPGRRACGSRRPIRASARARWSAGRAARDRRGRVAGRGATMAANERPIRFRDYLPGAFRADEVDGRQLPEHVPGAPSRRCSRSWRPRSRAIRAGASGGIPDLFSPSSHATGASSSHRPPDSEADFLATSRAGSRCRCGPIRPSPSIEALRRARCR